MRTELTKSAMAVLSLKSGRPALAIHTGFHMLLARASRRASQRGVNS